MEIWKDIPGYENLYQVSTLGNVKSIISNKTLKPGHTNGYKAVVLTKDKVRKTIRIHQLVAMAFLKHERNGMKKIIDHIDGDKLNNNLSNLQIVDNRYNINKSKNKKNPGVHVHSCGKWTSQIRNGSCREYLGLFDTEQQAIEAYKKKA